MAPNNHNKKPRNPVKSQKLAGREAKLRAGAAKKHKIQKVLTSGNRTGKAKTLAKRAEKRVEREKIAKAAQQMLADEQMKDTENPSRNRKAGGTAKMQLD
mmetsp:Transcript_20699/g.24889  ORF Transcript_20699/g.24889 Transcript_20699/m.24889 type:complete len:100 (-) Transcript_20699:844-1143(-)|eukprot:CAMPEP_0197851236 /NCGR_PEP_ID=MMETSP1438-20131217/17597_1 /TAXON_ID=1461541 /ORGANISM="Pterosperma sp., Strain CCMP1384" /LENGTH=99 /DNA_ID=CAMNT_0043464767 /DNA_START=186 /DNA_END=485 /DNA_ORIENTATION=+